MEFHEYKLTKNCNAPSEIVAMSVEQYYWHVDQRMRSGWNPGEKANLLCSEIGYLRCKRPFYHVYPAVESCLENTKLDFELKQIGHLDEVIAMCFAVGKEPSLSNGKVASMLVELVHAVEDVTTGSITKDPMLRIAIDRIGTNGKRCFSSIVYNRQGLISEVADELGDKRKLVSLAVGVSLLAQDQRFAEPILLKRDQGKQLDDDALRRAIERAKNRGRNGVAIGKGLEVSPHMRKPHFAIRWTGKGGSVPRLVPVKGCVVSRDKLFPVPTGHLDK
jgi:hypothetical protein